jgi:hypothetical protein
MEQMASAGPASDGVLDQLKFHLAAGFGLYKKHFVNGALTMGLVVVPATLLNVALGWVPVLGVLVAILTGLAQLALTPFSAGAMGRWALAAATDREVGWKSAWKAAFANPGSEWLNVFVAMIVTALGTVLLIVPGIIVGMFALPSYLMEDKKLIQINLRSAELVMKDPGRYIGLGLLVVFAMIPLFLLVIVLGIVLAFIPVVGSPLATLISTAVYMLVLPFVYLLWSRIYYDARRRFEGTDPVATQSARFDAWSQGTHPSS